MINIWKKMNLVFAAVLLFAVCSMAQGVENTSPQQQQQPGEQNTQLQTAAQELTENLATKVTLTDEQKQQIQDAIYQYQSSVVGISPDSHTGAQQDATRTDKSSGVGTEQGNSGTDQGTAGTEQGAAGTQEGATSTEQGTTGTEQSTTDTEQGVAGTEQGVAGTEQGVAGTEQDATGQASNMPQGDMDQWLNSQIENVLQDNQKAQWEVAKADFWNQLRDNISSFQKDSNGMY